MTTLENIAMLTRIDKELHEFYKQTAYANYTWAYYSINIQQHLEKLITELKLSLKEKK